jgi:hypothetical protein
MGLPHITPVLHRIATASCNIAAKGVADADAHQRDQAEKPNRQLLNRKSVYKRHDTKPLRQLAGG